MPRPVFSRRFYAAQGLNGSGPSTIVPSGHVYVVKQVTFYMNSSASTITAFLEDEATNAALFSGQVAVGAGAWFGFFGSLVFGPGEGFHAKVDAGAFDAADVYIGGYDLTN
jgi:hypothetical protein